MTNEEQNNHLGDVKDFGSTSNIERIPTIDVDNYHGLTVKCVVVYLAILLVSMAQMFVIVSGGLLSRYMAADIGGAAHIQWLSQSNTIITLALATPISQVSEFFGRKWPVVTLCVLSVAGSIIVARASSMQVAIVGNAFASTVAATLPVLQAISSEILPRRYRPAAQGGINMVLSLSGALVLLAGTKLATDYNEGWRIMWYIVIGANALAGVAILFLYNPPLTEIQRSVPFRTRLGRLDWVGIVMLPIGLTLFVMAISWSQNPYPWSDAHVYGTFVAGMIVLIATALYEIFIKKDGLFHHGMFKRSRNFSIGLFGVFVEGTAFFPANNYFPVEIGILYETEPIRVGLVFAVAFFCATLGAAITAFWCSWRKVLRAPLIYGFSLFVIAQSVMMSLRIGTHASAWAASVMLGLGLGGVLTPLITAMQLAAPADLVALSSGAFVCSRTLGASIALPITTAIYNSLTAKKIPSGIAAAVLPLGLDPTQLPSFITALSGGHVEELMQMPSVTPQIVGAGHTALQQAFVYIFRRIWAYALAFSVVAVITVCFIEDPKSEFTMHVDAPIEKEEIENQIGMP